MAVVGIIANPASGKDIRRLVAHATVCDNMEKVNLVRRILLGLQAAGVDRVVVMPDYFGIGSRALDGLTGPFSMRIPVEFLAMEMTGGQEDSLRAAEIMNGRVDCIVTLGGDGTNRLVARGCGETPLLPVSTGTNNVFPTMLEGTVAGLAAGFIATGGVGRPEGLFRHKKIDVYLAGRWVDMALIDAVVLEDRFIGSRAVWDAGKIRRIVATRGNLANIGIASIVGALHPVQVDEPHGIDVSIGRGGLVVKAALGPGLVVDVPVHRFDLVKTGQVIETGRGPFVIALDGEREVQVGEDMAVEMAISDAGPWVVDVRATLYRAGEKGLLRTGPVSAG